MRLVFKILKYLFISIASLVIVLVVLIQFPGIQKAVATQVKNKVLSHSDFDAIQFERLKIGFTGKATIYNLHVASEQDSIPLAHLGRLKVKVSIASLLRKKIAVRYVSLKNTSGSIYHYKNDSYNFDHLIPESDKKKETKEKEQNNKPLKINVQRVELENVQFRFHDSISQLFLDVELGDFKTNMNGSNFNNLCLKFDQIELKETTVLLGLDERIIPQKNKQKNPNPILPIINAEALKLNNIIFRLDDLTKNSHLKAEVDKIKGNDIVVNIGEELVQVDQMQLKDSYYEMDYTADTAVKGNVPVNNTNGELTFSGGWSILVNQLKGKNNHVDLKLKADSSTKETFNPTNFAIHEASFDIKNTQVKHERISTAVESLSCRYREDNAIENFSAIVDMNHSLGRFEVNQLNTTNSKLKAVLDITYPLNETNHVKPWVKELSIKGHFTGNEVVYFAPLIQNYIIGNEESTGEIDIEMNASDPYLFFPKASFSYPDLIEFNAKGKARRNNTYGYDSIDISFDSIILPSPVRFFETSSNLPSLYGKGRMQGQLDSLLLDLLFKDQFNSTLEGNIDLWKREAFYFRSNLKTHIVGFENYLDDTLRGNLEANLNIQSIFNAVPGDSLLEIEAIVEELSFDSLKFNNIFFLGRLEESHLYFESNLENGELSANVSGIGLYTGDSLSTNFSLSTQNLNLLDYHLANLPAVINLNMKGNIGLSTEDRGFISSFHFDELEIKHTDLNEDLAPIRVDYSKHQDFTKIGVKSNEVSLKVHSNITSDSAHRYIKNVIGRNLNPNVELRTDSSKVFRALCEIQQPVATQNIISLFVADTFDIDSVLMEIDLQERIFNIYAFAPRIGYKGAYLKELNASFSIDDAELETQIAISEFGINDFKSNEMRFTSQNRNGRLASKLMLYDSRKRIASSIPLAIQHKDSLLVFGFNNDSLRIGYDLWTYSNNEILQYNYINKKWSSNGVTLINNVASIEFTENVNTVTGRARNLDLVDWFQFFSQEDYELITSGKLSGDFTITSHPDLDWTTAANINIDDISIYDIPYGDLIFSFEEIETNNYNADLLLTNNNDYLKYTANLGKASKKQHQSEVKVTNVRDYASIIDTNIIRISQGGIYGNMFLDLSEVEPVINGFAKFDNTKFYIPNIGANFSMDDETITISNDGIHFKETVIQDHLGNNLKLNGDILTNNFSDFNYNMDIISDYFQVLNSTKEQNENLYGQLVIRSNINLKGTNEAPRVNATLSILDRTNLTIVLPGDDPLKTESSDIVNFTTTVPQDSDADSLFIVNSLASVNDSIEQVINQGDFDILLTFNPKARFKVITNPISGDFAHFGLSGALAYKTIRAGISEINGNIQIVDGLYEMSFYEMIKKEFVIEPSSTIYFSGPFSNTTANLKAKHIVRTNSVGLMASESSGTSPEETALYSQRLPYELYFNVNGLLLNPTISFALDLPDEYKQNSPMIASKLNNLSSPEMEQERNMQVFALLVTGGFIAENSNVASSDVATATARNSLNSILSQQLNRITSDNIKYFDMNLGLNTYDDYARKGGQQTTDLDVQISKSLFDDRVSFEMESRINLDGTSNAPGQSSSNYNTDYKLFYNINEKGNVQLKAYNLSIYDLFDGDITNTGIGIIFYKDFEGKNRQNYVEKDTVRNNE